MKSERSHHDWQLLSTYLDGQLNARQKARLETRFNEDPLLRQDLQNLKQTRLVLRSAPRRKAPRNFTLDPSIVPSRSFPILFPVFSFASAVSAFLFVILVLVDSSFGIRQEQFDAAQPMPAAAVMEVEKEIVEAEEPAEGAELPPLINWGAPPSGPAMGLGGGGGGGVGGGEAPPSPMDEAEAAAPQMLREVEEQETIEESQPEEVAAPEVTAELPAEAAAVPDSEGIAEADSSAPPQEKETYAQEAPSPAAGEALPAPAPLQEESAEIPPEVPETEPAEPVESEILDDEMTESEPLPGGPILGIQPSSTPPQFSTQSVEVIEVEQPFSVKPLLIWLFGAGALLFGLAAGFVWKRSR